MSAVDVVRLMAREERRSAVAVERAAAGIAKAAEAAARALKGGGRLVYVGAGTSGRLGALDAAECPPTFGTRPAQVVAFLAGGAKAMRRAVEGAEDDQAAGARIEIAAEDCVVGIAASGVTRFVRGALAAAKARGATTVLVTCNPSVPRGAAKIMIALDVGPEVLAGSTRLKAGTATKMTLNAISTTAMVLLGKVHGPRMVDVRATNAKLRARATRMIALLAGIDEAAAAALLEIAGSVKTAVVMAKRGVPRREAEAILRRAGGHLRRALGARG